MSAANTITVRIHLNAQSSTGPKTSQGKAQSSKNATTHGIFCKSPLLPGEDPCERDRFANGLLKSLNPRDALQQALAEQIISDQWRLRRIRRAEAQLYKTWMDDQKKQFDQSAERKYPSFEQMLESDSCAKRARDPNSQYCKRYPQHHQLYLELKAKAEQNEIDRPVFEPDSAVALAEMLQGSDPQIELLQRYEQKFVNSIHKAINQLRKLKKEQPEEPAELTQMLLAETDTPQMSERKNEPSGPDDQGKTPNDGSKNPILAASSFSVDPADDLNSPTDPTDLPDESLCYSDYGNRVPEKGAGGS